MTRLGDLFPDELVPKTAALNKSEATALSAPQLQPRQLPRAGGPAIQAKAPAPVKKLERLCVKDLCDGSEVEGIYLVIEAALRVSRNGSKYIQASLGDKTGSVTVRQWDATERDLACYKTTYIKIRGRVETYKNAMQLVVFAAQVCDDQGINVSDFLPVSMRPIEEMEREFDALLQSFTDADYKRLLAAIFGDKDVRARFIKGPAAASVHHAWVHGLLEHVLSACKTAQSVAEQRPFLNRDLLLTGVILHDIGKIEEISAGPGFGYTDTGRLCGHIVLGTLLVDRFMRTLENFPAKKRDMILHMILSHHGTHEFGSPVTPVTAEAMALHHLECMDAKVQGIQTLIEKDQAAGNDGAWTDFARVVDGRIYKGASQP